MSSREEREAVKRAASIGEYRGENDLNRNAFHIERFIHIDGHRYPVTVDGTQYCAQVMPDRKTCGATLEDLRENAEWILNHAKDDARAASAGGILARFQCMCSLEVVVGSLPSAQVRILPPGAKHTNAAASESNPARLTGEDPEAAPLEGWWHIMNRMQHPSNNAVLGAPAGWDQKELPCGALPITRTDWDGVSAIVSFWKPTGEELATLNAGGSIALWVMGHTMPPVALTIDPPV